MVVASHWSDPGDHICLVVNKIHKNGSLFHRISGGCHRTSIPDRHFWYRNELVVPGYDWRRNRVNPGRGGLRLGIDPDHDLGRGQRGYLWTEAVVDPGWNLRNGDFPGINGGGSSLAGIAAAQEIEAQYYFGIDIGGIVG